MPILSIQVGQAGVSNRTPSWVYIETNDTFATVTTAGYLSGAAHEYVNTFQNNMMALISTKSSMSIGVIPVVYIMQIQNSGNGVWSLIVSGSDVVLPTTASHIATYTNTTGGLSEDPAVAITAGGLQTGLPTGGSPGVLTVYPSAASKGSFSIDATANTGNTSTILTNVAMGQLSFIGIPDPANTFGRLLIGATTTPFVSGNFPKNSGTGGLMVDSGIAVSSLATTANAVLITPSGNQSITADNLNVAAGSISSGLATGGFVGLIEAFPTTASSGFIATQAAVNASGNFGTTLSNQTAQAQSTVLTFPDVGAATGNVLAAGAALVSGNLNKASGTSGAIVDSGITATSVSGAITQLGQLFQVSVTFNTASMVTAYDTPLTIVGNPSASQVILLLQTSVYTASTGHTAYATGTAPIIQYSTGGTNGQHGLGTIATAAGLVAGDITAATSQVRNLFGIATAALTGLSGKGIYFSNATGDYTAGTGTSVTITLVYQLLTATI